MKDLTYKESAAQAAKPRAAPPPQPRRASIFYYLFALAALFLDLFLFHMVERVTYGVSAYWGFVPGGLAILFRFRYCLFMVPLVLFAIGRLSSRTAWPRTPVAMACAAIATLLIFFYAALMLATPVIANLPIDYDVDKSVPLRISEEERIRERLADNKELFAAFADFNLATGRQERIKSAVSIQKGFDNILLHGGIIASPSEVRRLLGEPNEIYSTAPCASNSWYYWISPESRTNGFLNIWWQTRFSKRTNQLAGIYVATYAPEECD